jgi:hypothetical protein
MIRVEFELIRTNFSTLDTTNNSIPIHIEAFIDKLKNQKLIKGSQFHYMSAIANTILGITLNSVNKFKSKPLKLAVISFEWCSNNANECILRYFYH